MQLPSLPKKRGGLLHLNGQLALLAAHNVSANNLSDVSEDFFLGKGRRRVSRWPGGSVCTENRGKGGVSSGEGMRGRGGGAQCPGGGSVRRGGRAKFLFRGGNSHQDNLHRE